MESVAEVKAVVVNNTADYARVGYFDTITKSGTNDFHFDGSYYYRNSAFAARDFFEDQKTQESITRSTLRARAPSSRTRPSSTPCGTQSVFHHAPFTSTMCPPTQCGQGISQQSGPLPIRLTSLPFADNKIPDSRISSVTKSTQDLLIPAPNRGDPNLPVDNFTWTHPYPDDQYYADVFSARVDHRVSEKNSLYGRIQTYFPKYILAGNYPATVNTKTRHSYSWVVTDTHAFSPNLVNSFTFGGNYDAENYGMNLDGNQPIPGAEQVQQIGLQGVNQAGINSPGGSPVFDISGYSEVSTGRGGYDVPNQNYQCG